MQFRFSFKHMETSPSLEKYAREKIQVEVEKFATKPIEAHVTFSVDKYQQQVICTLTGGDGFKCNVEHSCEDMYGSIDHMIDKLVTQLQRKKEKLKDHKHFKVRDAAGIAVPDLHELPDIDASDILKYEKAMMRRRG